MWHVNPCYLLHPTSRNEGLVQSTSSLSKTRMHPPSACFLGGLRMYKIVLLGEGGVGKSGKFVHGLTSRLTEGIREQTLAKGNSVDRWNEIASWMSLPSRLKFSIDLQLLLSFSTRVILVKNKIRKWKAKRLFVCSNAPFSSVNYKIFGIPQSYNICLSRVNVVCFAISHSSYVI